MCFTAALSDNVDLVIHVTIINRVCRHKLDLPIYIVHALMRYIKCYVRTRNGILPFRPIPSLPNSQGRNFQSWGTKDPAEGMRVAFFLHNYKFATELLHCIGTAHFS